MFLIVQFIVALIGWILVIPSQSKISRGIDTIFIIYKTGKPFTLDPGKFYLKSTNIFIAICGKSRIVYFAICAYEFSIILLVRDVFVISRNMY